jgi:hypothetical protein
MLSPSPPEEPAAPTIPLADSTAEEEDGLTAGGVEGGEGEDSALATTAVTAVTAVAGEQELSGIAKAMRELEEAACPKKRTMTRFSFLGGACNN